MRYKNSEMRLDELIGYFRAGKINLIPPFQRGRVWTPRLRKKLMENIIRGKPIPAIFFYKEASTGSTYSYNILDGKQRLESILLFIGDKRPDLSIGNWEEYFFRTPADVNFKINVAAHGDKPKRVSFAELDDDLVRNFREYSIPTIDIDLSDDDDDGGGLNEIINLFIDINQLGIKVSRFDIVRTMYEHNQLLSSVFRLVGMKQRRKKDNFYKLIDTDFTKVLKRLQIINSLPEAQERVDRSWERLLEIVLFIRTGAHRTLAQILKAFIGAKVDTEKIKGREMTALRKIFKFVRRVYSQGGMKTSRLATDQTHFYTMITSIHSMDMIGEYGEEPLKTKIAALSRVIDKIDSPPAGKSKVFREYMELSAKQTTHPGRRAARQDRFAELIEAL